MLQLNIDITQREKDLIEAIREVKFGEMYGVEIQSQSYFSEHVILTPSQHDLIQAIRNGLQDISVLSIHNGDPAFAEVDEVINGFRCRKKIKFPTSH